MTRTIVARTIDAPVDVVFKAVSEVGNLPNTVPDIVKVEFLSDVKSGVGTRFRETRLMNGKESMTELEVTEFIDNEHVRMVADSHGTVWDSVFCGQGDRRANRVSPDYGCESPQALAQVDESAGEGFDQEGTRETYGRGEGVLRGKPLVMTEPTRVTATVPGGPKPDERVILPAEVPLQPDA